MTSDKREQGKKKLKTDTRPWGPQRRIPDTGQIISNKNIQITRQCKYKRQKCVEEAGGLGRKKMPHNIETLGG